MLKKLLAFFLLCVPLTVISQTTTPPVLSCVSVVNTDQVELTWDSGTLSILDFFGFEILRSDDLAGPFVSIDYISDTTATNYIDVSANADDGERYYKIEKDYIFEDPEASNIVASIHLERIPTDFASINLTWNTENVTTGFGSIIGDYELQKKVENGPWVTVATGSNLLNVYQAEINDCQGDSLFLNILYRVRVEHPEPNGTGTECVAFSNVIDDEFKDVNQPDPVLIETVSVNYNSGEVEVFWYPSNAIDIGEYFVVSETTDVMVIGNIDNMQDSVLVPLNNLEDPSLAPYGYSVYASDDCYYFMGTNLSGDSLFDVNYGISGPPHTTMFLVSSYNVCDQELFFNWTPYEGWPAGVSHYEILASINNGPLEILETIPNTQTAYSIFDIDPNEDYCFVINAVCQDTTVRSSLSNKTCLETVYPPVAEDFGIVNVSVINDSQVEVVLEIDQAVQGAKYRLEKLSVFGDQYDELITYPQAQADINGIITYFDLNATNDNQSHSYRLTAIDSCNNEVFTTPVSSTIHLEVFSEIEDFSCVLTWNPYEYWEDDVLSYRVYFSHDKNMPAEPKFIMSPEEFYKRDVVDEFRYTENQFCYRIDAEEAGPQNEKYISKSNIKCVGQTPLFYLPNAIVINGRNTVFRPYGSFLQFDDFSMEIYNRWGQLIYQTNDFYKGWDGSFGGDYVRDGLYGYFINYTNGDGTEGKESGVVTVLRAY